MSGNSATSTPVTVTVNNVAAVPAPAARRQRRCNLPSVPGDDGAFAVGCADHGDHLHAGSLFPGTTYYWYVAAQNTAGSTASPTRSFSMAAVAQGAVPSGGSVFSYTSPYCGSSGGSTGWACGAWPTTTPPRLGAAGTTTADPDTKNRVLRLTQSGSFGETSRTAFKVFDAGWKQAWNADSTRFIVQSWDTIQVKNARNWVGFNPASMSLTGARASVPYPIAEAQWDQNDPDLIVGLANGSAKSYNIVTKAWATLLDPASTNWGGTPWLSSWGGQAVCIAAGPHGDISIAGGAVFVI